MIRTNNAEMDAMIEVLQAQRNEAQDAVAVLGAKLKAQEALAEKLREKLDEALKTKEGEA